MHMTAIMSILLVHEMGHYTAARVNQVDASLPYFIPLPPFILGAAGIGTLGAVIHIRQIPHNNRSLLDIGAAGPLAGVLIAIPICYLGLVMSDVFAITDLPKEANLEGNSLIYLILKKIAHPEMQADQDISMHPLAWAGWLGLLVTSLNLLPAGQLDGGHILYALFGQRIHKSVATSVVIAVGFLGVCGFCCLLISGYNTSMSWAKLNNLDLLVNRGTGLWPWLIWFFLLRFIGRSHPTIDDEQALDPKRRVIGWIALCVLVLTFTPVFISKVQP